MTGGKEIAILRKSRQGSLWLARKAISARLDHLTEDVEVVPIVVSELELIDVQRQVLRADLVERAHDAALHHAPEPFDGVRVNRSDNPFLAPMVNDAEGIFLGQRTVGGVLVGAEKRDFARDDLAHEVAERFRVDLGDNTRHDFALPPFALAL